MDAYRFRAVSAADLTLLRKWREAPHVSAWWGAPDVEPEAEKLAAANAAIHVQNEYSSNM